VTDDPTPPFLIPNKPLFSFHIILSNHQSLTIKFFEINFFSTILAPCTLHLYGSDVAEALENNTFGGLYNNERRIEKYL
jgi:hypothetical protein